MFVDDIHDGFRRRCYVDDACSWLQLPMGAGDVDVDPAIDGDIHV